MAAEIMAPMGHPDYKSEIAEIIRSSLAPKLKKERILSYHENDIAAALSLLTREERSKFYNILDIKDSYYLLAVLVENWRII